MRTAEFSVKRPVTIVIVYLLVLIVGALLVPRLAVDLYPAIEPPVLSVATSYSGAGPEDVERNVTEIIERALSTTEGLEEIYSTSSQGFSYVRLHFSFRTDMDEAASEVESTLNALRSALPDDADAPSVRQFNLSQIPIMHLAVRGNYSLEELRRIAEDDVQPLLERIEGVASTSVRGGTDKIVKVEVSQNRLDAYNLTMGSVARALSGNSILVSGGSISQGSKEYQLRTQEDLTSVEDVRRIVVARVASGITNGSASAYRTVRLEDVAEVYETLDEASSIVYINGQPGMYVSIQNESDSNSVRVSSNIREALKDINSEIPPGVTVEVLRDNTTMVNSTLNQVYSSAFQGILLAMAVLFIFLRNLRGTFIIGLAIPISILITLMCMSIFNLTLNLLTLTGLILGLGMTVDSSIVILENIFQYRERGARPRTAAVLGSQEMIRAITASTVTTLCVFIPVVIFQNQLEMMGQMFRDLVFTVVISLIASLVVAVTLVPALAGPIMKLSTRVQKPLKIPVISFFDRILEGLFKAMERGYRKLLARLLETRVIFLVFILTLLGFSLVQFTSLGINLFVRPRSDDRVSIDLTLPEGTQKERTEEVLLKLRDEAMEKVEGYTNIIVTVNETRWFGGGTRNNTGELEITLPPPAEQTDTPMDIIRKLTPYMQSVPGADFSTSAGRHMGDSSAVDIKLTTKDLEEGLEAAQEIRSILLRQLPEVENPAISMEEGAPELRVRIDRERADDLGVSYADIATEIRYAYYGVTPASMDDNSDLIDIVMELKDEDKASIDLFGSLFVLNNRGMKVPLAHVTRLVEGTSPTEINREQMERVIHVTGDLGPDIAASQFQSVVEETVRQNFTPREEIDLTFTGEAEEIEEFSSTFIWIILAAVFLVFGVMASQFESFVDPFIIFFSIPLLAIGVIWMYRFSGEPFTLFSAVGVVALVGIVVNNGIVLVDYTNLLRARGESVDEACLNAGQNRLRPILMTSLTTILGMVPLAFFPGEGSETIQPIGRTLVGGLAVSMILTPFVTPVMYSLLNRGHERRAEKRRAEKEKAALSGS